MRETQSNDPVAQTPSRLYSPLVSYLLVAILVGLIVFMQLGNTILDEHEAKAALSGRNMAQPDAWLTSPLVEPHNGAKIALPPNTAFNHWMVPVNFGAPRLVKTPLPYWCIAGLGRLAGTVNEWVARFPSALSAILLAWVTLGLGRKLFGPRVGLLGALLLATSFGFQRWGRNARPEMMLCLWIAVAMASFYLGLPTGKAGKIRIGWMAAFWVAMGLANLSKEFLPLLLLYPLLIFVRWDARQQPLETSDAMPAPSRMGLAVYLIVASVCLLIGVFASQPIAGLWSALGLSHTLAKILTMFLLIAAPLIGYALYSRPWRAFLHLMPTAGPGFVVMLAMFTPWMWYMHTLFPDSASAIFNQQVTMRAAGTGSWHSRESYYYLPYLCVIILPWVVLLPGALAVPWMQRFAKDRRPLMYLFLWNVGLLALLTLSAEKRPHYILPMVPALALLMAYVLDDMFFVHTWLPARSAKAMGIGYGLTGMVTFVVIALGWAIYHGRPLRFGHDSLPISNAQWLHLFLVALVVGALMFLAFVRSWQGKLSAVPTLMALGMAAVYVVFYAGQPLLWDERESAADFARQAAGVIPPGASIASNGNPQAKTVFYLQRNIPSVFLLAGEPETDDIDSEEEKVPTNRMDRFLADADNVRFLKDPAKVAYLFCYDDTVSTLEKQGYQRLLRVPGQKTFVFCLLRNANAPATAAAK